MRKNEEKTHRDTCHIFVDERLQLFYLRSELSDEFHVCVFVDSRLVNNVFRTIGVSKSAESVVVIAFRRTDSRYHDSLGVAAQRIFQQPREHAVAIRNKRSFCGRCITAGRTELRERGYHSA